MDIEKVILSSMTPVLVIGDHGQIPANAVLRSLHHVCQKHHNTDSEIVLLGTNEGARKTCWSQTISQHFISVYRRHRLATNDRQTVLSSAGHLLLVQLCLAEYNKQKHDLFEVDISEVLLKSKKILQYKLSNNITKQPSNQSSSQSSQVEASANEVADCPIMNMYEDMLRRCNMVDLVDILRRVQDLMSSGDENSTLKPNSQKYMLLQLPEDEVEKAMLDVLKGDVSSTLTAINIHSSSREQDDKGSELQASSDIRRWSDISHGSIATLSAVVPKTPRSASATEVFARQLILSHLSLLVNTRDELSLARCLSLPDGGMGLDGFTALRKAAKEKNMPMYQTMVSFIMRLRLGGKSYAPDTSSGLGGYVKPMGEFVNLIQKMQTIAEEMTNAREAVKKILSSVKVSLLKSQDNALRASSLEKVTFDLCQEVDVLLNDWKDQKSDTPTKIVGQGRVIYGQGTTCIIRCLVDRESGAFISRCSKTQMLADTLTSQKTPVRLPCIISQFRSPDVTVDQDSPENTSLRERLRKSLDGPETKKVKLAGGVKSFMIWAEPVVAIGADGDDTKGKTSNQETDTENPAANHSQGLWADSPDDRSLAKKRDEGGVCKLSSDLIDRIVSTPKRVRNVCVESVDDQENIESEETVESSALKHKNTINKAKTKKRLLMTSVDEASAKPAKKAKRGTTKAKKQKEIPLGKGQKTLTHFFRV